MRNERERVGSMMLFRVIFISFVVMCVIGLNGMGIALAQSDISGEWESNFGKTYRITQLGTVFNWNVPGSSEFGVGDVEGDTAKALWPFGYAEGIITTDSADRGTMITWDNGVIFTRPGDGGAPEPEPGPEPEPALEDNWELIGTSATEIYAGGGELIGVISGTGDIYQYNGSPNNWTMIGWACSSLAVDSNGYIYGITPDGVWAYSGMPMSWALIWDTGIEIYAGGRNLFATDSATGDIYRYSGTPHNWTMVGGSGNMFAIDDTGRLYGLSGAGIWEFSGTPESWTQISGPALKIFAGGDKLFATFSPTGDIYQYNGSPHDWTRIGTSGMTFTVDSSGQLYGLSPTGVFRYDGTPMGWTQIGGPGVDIEAGRNELYGLTSDGRVWRYIP